MTSKSRSGLLVLGSASLLSLVLGSVHAFSVFLEPIEAAFSVSRANASLIYSLALVSLTISVLVGHHVFKRVRSASLVAIICGSAAAGTAIAAFSESYLQLLFGYSLVFGAANGFGYVFGLQMSAQASPGKEGLAMGIVTAFYAIGAAVSPYFFSMAVTNGGLPWALGGLSICLLFILPVCVWSMSRSGQQIQVDQGGASVSSSSVLQVSLLWVGYGAGVAAGLMVIGHATGILKSANYEQGLWVAPVVIALSNMIGSLAGGWLTDRLRPSRLLVALSLLSSLVLLTMSTSVSSLVILVGLGAIGFLYGAQIASYPASISKRFGAYTGSIVYGRVFTAWGTAGLAAPWLAGWIFDQRNDYFLALQIAAALGIISAIAMMFFGSVRASN